MGLTYPEILAERKKEREEEKKRETSDDGEREKEQREGEGWREGGREREMHLPNRL